MPRIKLLKNQSVISTKIINDNNYNNDNYKKICEVADKRIREYHKRLSASYSHA